jgi:hypothetical protein
MIFGFVQISHSHWDIMISPITKISVSLLVCLQFKNLLNQ